MTLPNHTGTGDPRLDLVEALIDRLVSRGLRLSASNRIDWREYHTAAERIHQEFEIPSTSMSAVMRRFFYAIGWTTRPRCVLSLGNYVGYCSIWLSAYALQLGTDSHACHVVGVDTDIYAASLFERNIKSLNCSKLLCTSIIANARELDLLYFYKADIVFIDVDDLVSRKDLYPILLSMCLDAAPQGALILLHDSNVPSFRHVFQRVLETVGHSRVLFSVRLPVDDAGVMIVYLRA